MDFINSINLEQLGTAGLFVAYLIWQLHKKEIALQTEKEERMEWQETAFKVLQESQVELYKASDVLDKALDKLK